VSSRREFHEEVADDALQGLPVPVRPEEWPTTMPTECDMMNLALEAQAGADLSGHAAILTRGVRSGEVGKATTFEGFALTPGTRAEELTQRLLELLPGLPFGSAETQRAACRLVAEDWMV